MHLVRTADYVNETFFYHCNFWFIDTLHLLDKFRNTDYLLLSFIKFVLL